MLRIDETLFTGVTAKLAGMLKDDLAVALIMLVDDDARTGKNSTDMP